MLVTLTNSYKRIEGDIFIKRKGKTDSKPILSLSTVKENMSFYSEPLSFYGRGGNKYFEIAKGGDDRIHVADEA